MNGQRRCNNNSNAPTSRMSKLLALTVAAAGLHGGLAQTSSSLSSNLDGCVTDFNATAGVDYFPDKAVVEFAETFSVEYFPTYKVLTVQAEGFNTTTYVLYQCGTPVPTLDEEVQEYISVPVTTVSTGTPDHIPRIELLGHRDSIVAYTGDVDRIGSPCVDALVEDGTVEQALVFDTREECQTDAVDNEALIAAGVEVAFGDSLETSWCLGEPVENGVQVLLYAEGGETIGLGHGEGIKFFSLFYNEEAKGNELFEEIETKWFCTKDNAAGCSLQLAESPTVAWFSYTPTDPAFGNAGSGWGAPDNDTYYAQAVSNTGGTLLYCGSFEWYELWNDEQMLDCFADADVCVFGDDYAEVERFFNASALESLACVQNERVYDITLSGINAWFEAVNVEPHVLMEDMVVALHGEDADFGIGTYERLLLRHYHTEESDSGSYYPDVGTCTDPDAVLELQGECEIILDFDAVCDGTVTADGQDSPASSVLPGRLSSVLATVFVAAAAAAASLW